MPKAGTGRIEIYSSFEQLQKIRSMAKKLDISISELMITATMHYWKKDSVIGKLASELSNLKEERERKNNERDTGDLLGSYEKKMSKIRRAKALFEKGIISRRRYRQLFEDAVRNYDFTCKQKWDRLDKRVKKYHEKKK